MSKVRASDLRVNDRLRSHVGMPGEHETIVRSVKVRPNGDIEVWLAPQTPDALDPECRNFGRTERRVLRPDLVLRRA